MQIIKAGINNYLSEFLEDLPDNVILNKVTCGSGMTSLALTNNVKYVITVPYVNIILSKLTDDILGVYSEQESGVSYQDILEFGGNKIMCTYDSLPKVTDALYERGDLLEWKLLVDECQKLVDAGSFRANAIRGVLNCFRDYGSFVFGTATPVRDEYQLPQLRDIEKAVIHWEGLLPVSVHHGLYDSKLNEIVATKAISYLEGYHNEENAHFFINSVQDIIIVIRYIKKAIKNDVDNNIRIVCANTLHNDGKILKDLGNKYFISPINSEVKKINFYTSTAFEGCDIIDANGRTFIVSNGSKDYCKIDILTTLPQIIGRIRNSKTKNEVELIYSPSNYTSFLTEEEYSNQVKVNLLESEDAVNDFKIVSSKSKELLLAGSTTNNYFLNIDEELVLNDTVWYSEMNAFHTLRELYYVNPRTGATELDKTKRVVNGINYNYSPSKPIKLTGVTKSRLGKVPNFSDLCRDYFSGDDKQREFINDVEPIIEEAYNILGEDKMIALLLRKNNISKELTIINTSTTQASKIVELLSLEISKFYTSKEIKVILQEVYDILNINKIANPNDLKQWYSVKETKHRINSISTRGIVVLTCNIKK